MVKHGCIGGTCGGDGNYAKGVGDAVVIMMLLLEVAVIKMWSAILFWRWQNREMMQ